MKQLLTKLLLVPIVLCIVNTCFAQAPTISSFAPSSGPVGTLVTVLGTNQNNSPTITIGGVTAIVISNTATQTVAMVMPGAATGAVAISTTGGIANAVGNFTVSVTKYPGDEHGDNLVGIGNPAPVTPNKSIAISADGNTAILGSKVYVRTGVTWSQQGPSLVGASAVALSADGNTAILGDPGDNSGAGAAFIYTRSGTTWVQQGTKLVGSGSADPIMPQQGWAVSLSADGNTAAVGAPNDGFHRGAVWIFVRTGTTWTQQGAKLLDAGPVALSQGYSLKLSGDGNTLITGANADFAADGGAVIFMRTGTTWTQQGAMLTATGLTAETFRTGSVSISADGNTAIIGSAYHNGNNGASWIFIRTGTSWSLQAKLVGTGGTDHPFSYQGTSVVLSADGNTAIVGGVGDDNSIGAVWIFTRTGTTWTQHGLKIKGPGPSLSGFGVSIDLTPDGTTAIISSGVGVWVYTVEPPPAITSFSPASGPVGTQITITGTGLRNLTGLAIGATAIEVISSSRTQVIGTILPGSVSANISLSTTEGATTSAISFTVTATPPPTITSFAPTAGSPGTLVSINGTNLNYPSALTIGGVPAIIVSFSATKIVGMVMPGAATGAVALTAVGGGVRNTGSFTVTATPYPNAQQGAKLVGTGFVGKAQQGQSVDISADGNTAIVAGGSDDNGRGAAWIYTRIGGRWTQQGGKLVGTGSTGTAGQGKVAISADGNTVIIGASGDNGVWIFTRTGTTWLQQGPKLVGTGAGNQGYSVSLSADGNTAMVGCPDNGTGGALIYKRTGTTWVQQTLLVGSGGTDQGYSVKLSADGNTAIIGSVFDMGSSGAAWIFKQTGNVWTQESSKITVPGFTGDKSAGGGFGRSVSISADGNTAIVGGPNDHNFEGGGWVYVRNSGVWSQQGLKLVGNDAQNAYQGTSVSLSADGNTALVSGWGESGFRGAAWTFTRTGTTWTQKGAKLLGVDPSRNNIAFGFSVSLSADGSTAVIGAFQDEDNSTNYPFQGAARIFTFFPPPTITSFTPITGPAGTQVTITGTNLDSLKTLAVGGAAMTIVSKNSTQAIGTIVLGSTSGTISLTTTGGTVNSVGTFTVIPTPPPTITSFAPAMGPVGTLVTIIGTNFSYLSALSIGGASAIVVSVTSTQMVAMVMPGAVTGTVALSTVSGATSSGVNFTIVQSKYPVIQQGSKLIGTGNIGASMQGSSVAVSADGNTAVVGGNRDNHNPDQNGVGAFWIYRKIGTTWQQQGEKLIGSVAVGESRQGEAVAINADGSTIIIGAPGDSLLWGSAWVFTRTGTSWTQQAKLVTQSSQAGFGSSVSISADGNTAIIGAPFYNTGVGAAWVFVRNGSVWTEQRKLMPVAYSQGFLKQGVSVAISADGNTAIMGGTAAVGLNIGLEKGSAWVFMRNGSDWTLGDRLEGTGSVGTEVSQGNSVALSADGKTAVVAGYGDNNQEGAVWIFTRAGNTWTQQGEKLLGQGLSATSVYGQPHSQGSSVSISADGNTVMVGVKGDSSNLGAVLVYKRTGTTWTQQGNKIVGTGGIKFSGDVLHDITVRQGYAISISADGNTAIVGGLSDNEGQGAAWIFVPADPAITTSGSLTAMSVCKGNPSAAQSFKVSAKDLLEPLVITMPAGFEISLSASGSYSSSLTIATTDHVITEKAIYVRLAGSAAGASSGSIVLTSSGATSQTISVNGTVNTTTVPTITADKSLNICAGDNLVLSASSATGNQWYKNNTLIAGATGQTFTATQSGVYIDSVTSTGGCRSGSISTTVTVYDLPAVPVITNSRPLTFCPGDSTVLTSSAESGNKWYKGGVSIAGQSNTRYAVYEAGTYRDTITNSNGCKVSSKEIVIVVNNLPVVPTITGPASMCPGTTAQFSSTTNGGVWSSSNTAVASVSATGGLVTGKTAGTMVITYVITNGGGCSSFTTTGLTVNAAPSVAKPVITGYTADVLVCFTESLILTSKNSYDKYLWSTGETTASITVKNSAYISLKGGPASGTSCYSADSSIIINARKNVTPVPVISRVNNKLGSTASLSYQWYQNNKILDTQTSDSLVIPSKGFYSVTTSIDNICYASSSEYLVLVDPSAPKNTFDVQVYPNPSSGVFKVQVLLSKSTSGFVSVTLVDQSGAVKWNTKRFLFANNDIKIPASISNLAKGTYTLRVEVNGEVNTKQVVIQ